MAQSGRVSPVRRDDIPDAHDVAAAIIARARDVDQMKLHKLLYYAQAWYLAWYGVRMFKGRIEAWQYGPYVPRVGRVYGVEQATGRETIAEPAVGNADALDEKRLHVLESVIEAYDGLSGPELADLTKMEGPWHVAREGRQPDQFGRDEIRPSVLRSYFRREAQFGPRQPATRIDRSTLNRALRGDRDAVLAALEEAARVE
jgi:uncharacterized phage-associated protein